jgi:hypothetical protein
MSKKMMDLNETLMSYLRILVESVEDGVIVTNRLRKMLDANQTLVQTVLILCECVENTLLTILMGN